MPIDKDGIIYVEKKVEKQIENEKKKVKIKDICLLITTFLSILGLGVTLYQSKLQKLESEHYEKELELEKEELENHIKELELEERKYENILEESKIQLRTSYLLCRISDAETLWSTFEEYNIKIFSNEITDLFYNKETKEYYQNDDIFYSDYELKYESDFTNSQIIFLRIDIVSNRIVNNLTLDCLKISSDSNFDNYLDSFSSFKAINANEENSEHVTIDVGDVFPGDMILVPLAVNRVAQYSVSSDVYANHVFDNMTYKIVYAPQSISYYDEFNNQTFSLEIRDMYSGALLMEYTFLGLG